jgi:hypothetical protein
MRALAEQIAVLDGVDTSSIDIEDGRIGQRRAQPDQYAKMILPDVLSRRNVIDPSSGANYSGGSNYAPGLPLMPSSVGLANLPSVLPPRRHVIDPSGGANYSGGSSYSPGLPLLPSSSGLAAAAFGNAAGGYVDQDLAGAFNGFEAARSPDGVPLMPGVIARQNVIDPSGGANYSGGSSYAPGLPLMPSTIGLAGLDHLADSVFLKRLPAKARAAFKKFAGRDKVKKLAGKVRIARIQAASAPTPMGRAQAANLFANTSAILNRVRQTRKTILTRGMVGGVPVTAYASVSPSSLADAAIVDGVRVTSAGTYTPTMWK